MTKRVMWVLIISLMFLLYSCNGSGIKEDLAQILNQHILIPYDQLDKRECSYFRDTSHVEKCFTMVFYMDGNQCIPCELAELSSMEKSNKKDTLWQKLHKVYIFDVKPENTNALYMKLCNYRIEQDVLFDTCRVFRQSNPQIPNSKIFHTFVLDRNDNVMIVGNPFKNKRLKDLLLMITQEH